MLCGGSWRLQQLVGRRAVLTVLLLGVRDAAVGRWLQLLLVRRLLEQGCFRHPDPTRYSRDSLRCGGGLTLVGLLWAMIHLLRGSLW